MKKLMSTLQRWGVFGLSILQGRRMIILCAS